MKAARAHGVTLIELMVGLAVLALLAALALPAAGARMERQRLALAAETLAADLTQARFDAAQRGQPMQVNAITGGAGRSWCWSVAPAAAGTAGACSCTPARPCGQRTVSGDDHPGVKMSQGGAVLVQANGTAQVATAAVFESPRGERLRVDLQALGRSRICSPAGPLGRYPAC